MQAALDQRTWLLNELDHRVKNNLQLISSLMLLQARHTPDPAVREALNSMLERLNAISTVHRRLFQSEDPERFDVSAFARDLVADLVRPEVTIELELEPVSVPSSKAAPLALLISELMTNALKHAFPEPVPPGGRKGRIRLKITRSGRELGIEIADNGVGMAGGSSADGSQAGFGLTIVDLLSRQLQARVVREDAGPGVRVRITLPVEVE